MELRHRIAFAFLLFHENFTLRVASTTLGFWLATNPLKKGLTSFATVEIVLHLIFDVHSSSPYIKTYFEVYQNIL